MAQHRGLWLVWCAAFLWAAPGSASVFGEVGAPDDGQPVSFHDAVRAERWDSAAKKLASTTPAAEAESGQLAFGTAWLWWQAGDVVKARNAIAGAQLDAVPAPYVRFLMAAIADADEGRAGADDAFLTLADDPLVGPLAKMTLCRRAESAQDADNLERFCDAAFESDPSGNRDADLILAEQLGVVGARDWNTGDVGKTRATELLSTWVTQAGGWQNVPPSVRVERMSRLVQSGNYSAAIQHNQKAGPWESLPVDLACKRSHAIGKALYRSGRWTDGAPHLLRAGNGCKGHHDALGAASLYLLGTLRARKSQHTLASEAYDLLAKTYPAHSMADDAYTRGGVSLFETGEEKAAAIRWKAALDEHPGGDTTTESARRLALWYYDNNNTDAAIDVAKRVQTLSGEHPDDARAWGAYWYARWLMYPSVASPETKNADQSKWAQGREAMAEACTRFPSSLYGSLAYARLMDVAPSTAQRCAEQASPPTHEVDSDHADATGNDAMRAVESLSQAGLLHEARRLMTRSAFDLPSMHVDLWWIRVMTRAGDTVQAHREARRFLKKYPIGTLGGLEAHAVATAYPDWYFAQIDAAVKPYDYDARLLHALAREESAFNVRVKSHAGAIGLTQVMPKTAEQTAGWLGITYTASKLSDPTYNATIGAKYLSHVYDDNGGNVALALAAYNAGPHRVDLWFKRFGNLPTDEFIERIPFKETRGYVRRVMGTWQILRWRSEEQPVYIDTSAYNHDIRPN